MTIENLAVDEQMAKRPKEFWDGVLNGYHHSGPMPSFWVQKAPRMFTLFERGWYYGYTLREYEEFYGKLQ